MRSARFPTLFVAAALAFGCTAQTGPYDPNWDPEGPVAGGKADGLLDIIPELGIGASATGDVGADRNELYRIDLARTDRIEIRMTVTSGDLNPHLSFFRGTSSYVGSESWDRDGDTLTKVYVAESAGTHVIAVRAYRGEGSGNYSVSVSCLGGPCAGQLPPPSSELELSDVADCVMSARRCSFSRLSRYNGAVGPVRARALMQECMAEATIWDGSTCADACDWVNPDDSDDTAAELCGDVIEALPFYADQSAECLGIVDSCMSDCYDANYQDHAGDVLAYSSEAMCWSHGFNGTCDGFARSSQACGGTMLPDSAGECSEACMSTAGVFVDDTDGICSYDDLGCEGNCDVDITAASGACGGISPANAGCLENFLDDSNAWFCFNQVEDQLADMCDLPTDATSEDDTAVLDRTATERARYTIDDIDDLSDRERNQLYNGARRLDSGGRIREMEDVFRFADDGIVYVLDATSGSSSYDWVKWYAGDNEVGVIFHAGTRDIAAVISDGDIDCVAR